MPVKSKIPFDNGHFFITFTCYKWLNLIDITGGYDLIYNWFDILKASGHYITGYVIMPNHIHATIAFRKTEKKINSIIGDVKLFIGYQIIKRLKQNDRSDLLHELEEAVGTRDKKNRKQHEVWEDSFDWKECNGEHFVKQKLTYMHNNPFSCKWQLSENAIDYLHSSAKYYLCGIQGCYEVLNFRCLNDIDLTKPQLRH